MLRVYVSVLCRPVDTEHVVSNAGNREVPPDVGFSGVTDPASEARVVDEAAEDGRETVGIGGWRSKPGLPVDHRFLRATEGDHGGHSSRHRFE